MTFVFYLSSLGGFMKIFAGKAALGSAESSFSRISAIMDKDGQPVAERILNLAIEIICLLTGERFPAVKSGDLVTIAVPPPDSLTVERNNEQKISEVAQKIIELLAGEVPNGPEEVEVSISLEQIVLQEAEKTMEKDTLEENEEVPQSEDLLEPTSTALVPDATVPSLACTNEVQNSNDQEEEVPVICDPIMSKLDLHSAVEFSSCDEGDLSDGESAAPINVQPTPVCTDDSQTVCLKKTSFTPDGTDALQSAATSSGQVQSATSYAGLQAPPPSNPLQSTTVCTNQVLSTHSQTDYVQSLVINCVTSAPVQSDPTTSTAAPVDNSQSTMTGNDHLPPAPSQVANTDNTQVTVTQTKHNASIIVSIRDTHPAGVGRPSSAEEPVRKVVRLLSPDKRPMCPDCGKCFRWQSEVLFHQRKHTGERPYCCSKCGQCFSRIPHLVIHERSHTGERPYICNECKKCFSSKSELNEHRKRHRGLRIHPCSECTKSFITKSDLNKHKRSHTGEKPHPCSICGKCFTLRSGAIRHEKTHTGERPYSCTECGKAYVSNSELVNHMRTHTGERPFSCIDCGKCFYSSSDLVKHRRCHTGEKPHLCSICGKSYSSKSVLYRHQKIHTRVKPFACETCGKCFSKEKTLESHQKIHKKNKPHVCNECRKGFYRPSALTKHMVTHDP
ncbi:uncharacterized protein [Pyxicephalus adspersus]|uniref:uncharacterized protein isoform X1 n=2 Tax=Pyxicephalus adspersus TaxID=30357 RepID=UPI003B5CE54E